MGKKKKKKKSKLQSNGVKVWCRRAKDQPQIGVDPRENRLKFESTKAR